MPTTQASKSNSLQHLTFSSTITHSCLAGSTHIAMWSMDTSRTVNSSPKPEAAHAWLLFLPLQNRPTLQRKQSSMWPRSEIARVKDHETKRRYFSSLRSSDTQHLQPHWGLLTDRKNGALVQRMPISFKFQQTLFTKRGPSKQSSAFTSSHHRILFHPWRASRA